MSEDARAHWRVNTQSFIGHSLVNEGDTVFYDPPPGGHVSDNLSPINKAAQDIVNAQAKPHPDKAVAKPKAPKAPKNVAEQPDGAGDGSGEGAGDDGSQGQGGDGDIA